MVRIGTLTRWYAVSAILKQCIKKNFTVLDIGAFDGYILSNLTKQVDFNPILLDLDRTGLKIAQAKSISPILASGTSIPFKSNSIDLVICLDVIEHIQEGETLMHEIARVLKKDGILVLTTPIADKKLVFFMSAKRMDQIHVQWGHVKYGYTLQELQYLFKGVNLNIVFTSQCFNILTRYLYYLLFICKFPIPNKIKQILFKMGLFSERFVRISGFEHLIVAKNR